MKLRVVHVVAMGRNRVIGQEGGMPWHLPGDLKHFWGITKNKPVIVGRRTFESIGSLLNIETRGGASGHLETWDASGQPVIRKRSQVIEYEWVREAVLLRRASVVVSRRSESVEGERWVRTVEDAYAVAEKLGHVMEAKEVAVIGGAEIYRQTLDQTERIYLTEVDAYPIGDVYYPEVDWTQWREISRQSAPLTSEDSAGYEFVVMERI